MKKVLEGWLDVRFEDTRVYKTKEELDWGSPYLTNLLIDELEPFHEKKIKITIEEVE